MKHLDPQLIQMLLDGEASDNEKQRAEHHIHDCAGCRAKLERAGFKLKAVMNDLEGLDPATVPSPPAFDRPLVDNGPKRPLIRVLVLSPIKVPAFLLILMAGVLIILARLLFVGNPAQKNAAITKVSADGPDSVTLISSAGETKIRLNTATYGFKVVEDPSILVLKKEDTNE
jgi:anti-sigma factor RsiW